MKSRLALVAAFVTCVALVGALFLWAAATMWVKVEPRSVTRTQFETIYEGMPAAELESMFGRPRNEYNTSVMVWVPDDQGQLVSAKVMPGRLAIRFYPHADHEQVWLTKTGLVAVSLDQQGRVQGKHFSTVHDIGGPPSWFPGWNVESTSRSP